MNGSIANGAKRALGLLALTYLVIGGGAGCLEKLPEPSVVESLRVLAVRADPPEVLPGAEVTLEALVVDPQGRDVSLTWMACLLPERAGNFGSGNQAANSGGGGYGLDDGGTCFDLAEVSPELTQDLGSGNPVTLTVPADLFDDLSALLPIFGLPADAEVPEPLVAGLLSIAGVNMTVSLRAQAGDEVVEAYKRVNVSVAPDANTNPEGLAFHLARNTDATEVPATATAPPDGRCFATPDGAPPAFEAGRWIITPQNLPDPPPLYTVIVGSTSLDQPFDIIEREERLFFSFFSTRGAWDEDIIKAGSGDLGAWRVTPDGDDPVPVWIVTRDGRGGTTWCHEELAPTP